MCGEIAQRSKWRKCEEIYKFTFNSKSDRDRDFNRRPWSFDGSHLILKEWDPEVRFTEINFDTSTFHIQVHGLPPKMLNAENARLISNKVGKVHEPSISKRTVVNHRYLRFRVDIQINEPLPAGFFQNRAQGDPFWVQFKFERLGDFCYRCGLTSHVTGRCKYKNPATISTSNDISARLYGPGSDQSTRTPFYL